MVKSSLRKSSLPVVGIYDGADDAHPQFPPRLAPLTSPLPPRLSLPPLPPSSRFLSSRPIRPLHPPPDAHGAVFRRLPLLLARQSWLPVPPTSTVTDATAAANVAAATTTNRTTTAATLPTSTAPLPMIPTTNIAIITIAFTTIAATITQPPRRRCPSWGGRRPMLGEGADVPPMVAPVMLRGLAGWVVRLRRGSGHPQRTGRRLNDSAKGWHHWRMSVGDFCDRWRRPGRVVASESTTG